MDKTLVPVTCEQTALREAIRMDRSGFSFRQIARYFDEQHVRPHRGKAWYASTVRDVLRSRIVTEAATIA
jgi:hypothetical protein